MAMGEVTEVMAAVEAEVGTEVVTLMVVILLAVAEVTLTAVIREAVEAVDTKHSFLRIPVLTLLKHESPLKCFSVLVNLCSTGQLTF